MEPDLPGQNINTLSVDWINFNGASRVAQSALHQPADRLPRGDRVARLNSLEDMAMEFHPDLETFVSFICG